MSRAHSALESIFAFPFEMKRGGMFRVSLSTRLDKNHGDAIDRLTGALRQNDTPGRFLAT